MEEEIGSDGIVSLSGPRADHISQVLGSGAGDRVRIGVLEGRAGLGTVIAVDGATVRLHCQFDTATPPRPRVDILLALPRPKVMRRLWSQLAALGVGRIILTNASRVERNYFDTHILSPECYRPLLIEGLQQAQDTRLPEVSIHRRLKVLIEDHVDDIAGNGARLVADPASTTTIRTLQHDQTAERILLAVGPEGGWTPFELRLLEAHGFESFTMGRRTLRSDTACIALVSLVHSLEHHGPV